MVVRIAGKQLYLWRAVDHEGEVLDMLVQRRRDSRAALRIMRKLLTKQGFAPKLLVTDKLRSYACAFRRLQLNCPHDQGLRKSNSMLRLCRTTPQDYPEWSGFGQRREREWGSPAAMGRGIDQENPLMRIYIIGNDGITLCRAAPATSAIAGAIAGVGVARGTSSVRWGVAGRIVFAWVLTLPVCAAMGALIYAMAAMF
jgi:hypothetical protein